MFFFIIIIFSFQGGEINRITIHKIPAFYLEINDHEMCQLKNKNNALKH